ncbi:MAG: DUF4924 family protein [Odoribacteraceae bacterium]|jgi:ABC-type transporter Mla MlaB component|nr:DUF4924 family protein [Odoribacteraceae bacterium]
MFIAREKRKENLAEYILYMWQVEDMLRAFRMDIRQVEQHVILPSRVDEAGRAALLEWYDNLIEMARKEGVTGKGHLQVVKNALNELLELHLYLLLQEGDPLYRRLHAEALPHLAAFRQKSTAAEETPDVELALQALYGQLILRLQKREIYSSTRQATGTFSRMLAYLAAKYKQIEETN